MGRLGLWGYRPFWAVVVLLNVLPLAGVASADNVDTLAERLIALRGEVDDLSAELTLQREEQKQQMAALMSQRSELAAAIKREQRLQTKLRKGLEQNREAARKAGADEKALEPVLATVIDELRLHIETGLPFKRAERLAALDEVAQQMSSGILSASRAANRLWRFYEDEIRLTRENGLYRQSIAVDGESLLSDVVRLGMMAMYFRTPDERYGMAQQSAEGWQFHLISDEENQRRVAALFESLQKQIRSGVFELPGKV